MGAREIERERKRVRERKKEREREILTKIFEFTLTLFKKLSFCPL